MAIITKDHTFIKGTIAPADQVNENFDTIYDEFNGSISDDNIDALAAIEQTGKIDNTTAAIVAFKIRDKDSAVTGTDLSAVEHDNADLLTGVAFNCVVGTDDVDGYLPLAALRNLLSKGDDSDFAADTSYKIAGGSTTVACPGNITTGLTTIVTAIVLGVTTGARAYTCAAGVISIAGTADDTFYWIAIGT